MSGKPGSRNYITLSRPVMQRLLDGQTKGLVIKPLGALVTSFYASENITNGPVVHFSTTMGKKVGEKAGAAVFLTHN